MRKFLLTTFVLFSVAAAEAQQGLFFNCTRDTVIDCTQTCVTLRGYIPNLHSLTDNYEAFSLNTGICNVRMQPSSAQGTPTNIIADDRYTPIVLMPFDFPFYGIYYNQLVASSNGIISFDINNASQFSHYGILSNGAGLSAIGGAPQNLPNTRYDRAIIMGPYHDIDISVNTSPNRRIFYQIEGNTPNYRKWILNFQEIPLFSGACNPLFQNTHQIILHESTGIVDVYIFDKQICMGWNEGRAMVGMQNYDRNTGIMIPGRRASDAPWGAVGLNEAWRFVPSEGPSLFKRVELLDVNNTVVAVGDTTSVNNTVFAVSFPNVCPSASGTFIIRSTYAKIDDPGAEIYAFDTVNIVRNSSVPPVTTTVADAPCGVNTTGTITVTAPLGANYLYSIDNGTTFQASPVFSNVVPGTYSVVVKDGSGACFNSTVAIVNTITTLTATATVINTSCSGASNGTITVNATLGTPGYQYAIDGGATPVYGNNNVFSGLDAGTHTISVKDAAGCVFNFNVDVNSDPGFSTTAVSTNASCIGVANGFITVDSPLNGVPPFKYYIPGIVNPQPSPVLTGLLGGASYTVTVEDASGCTFTFSQGVNNNPGVSASFTTVSASCAGVSNGQIIINPTAGGAPFQYALNGGTSFQALDTVRNLAAGTYTIQLKDTAGCTFNSGSIFVFNGAGVNAVFTPFNASCAGVNNGRIAIRTTSGTAPFRYSVDGGTTFQPLDTIRNLAAGTYNIQVIDANGCTLNSAPVTVGNDPGVTATFTTQDASCAGVSNGTIAINPSAGTAPYSYSLDGGTTYLPVDTIRNLAAGTFNILIRDAVGCSFTAPPVSVGSGPGITATITPINASCSGVNNGQIAISPSSGTGPYSYSLDGGVTYLPVDTIRNLATGNYSIRVRDALGCTYDAPAVTVSSNAGITASFTTVNASCSGISNGKIAINPGSGTAPFSYSLDGGATYNALDTIRNLAGGNYSIRVRDDLGCFVDGTATVNNDPGVSAVFGTVNTACTAASTGKIGISVSAGVGPFEYSLNGGTTYQPVDTIRNLGVGSYNIRIRDAVGCLFDGSATVGANDPGVGAGFTTVNASCSGVSNGKIAINPTQGVAPFSYSLDGGATYNALDTIRNLAGGNYSIRVRDGLGCTIDGTATVNNDPGVSAVFGTVNTACTAASTGKIGITVSAGVGPFEYFLNGGTTYQPVDTIRNLGMGSYNIRIRDAVGCLFDGSATVGANDPGVGAGFTTVNASCSGVSNGKIAINPTQGVAPFSYSLDGGATYNALDTIRNLAGGNYSIRVRDDLGCFVDGTATVNNDPGVSAVFGTVNTACTAASTGKIGITVSAGVGPFEYSLNGGTTYQPVDTIRNLGVGSYNIRIRDAVGCLFDGSATVGANDPGVGAGFTTVNASCSGVSNGKIAINPTQGVAPFSYSLDGGATYNALDTIRNLAGGNYSIRVRDGLGCFVDGTATVNNDPGVSAVFGTVNTACTAASTGKIGIAVSAGVGPFEYSLNGGTTYQPVDTIRNLGVGSYNIRIRDAVGCLFDGSATVGANDPGVGAGFTTVNASCSGVSNGKIAINPTQGVAPFSYSLDGGATYNALDTIRNLASGNYSIRVRDGLGCTIDGTATVNNDPGVSAVFGTVNTACTAASTGKIGIAVSAGVGPFEYSLNGGTTYQPVDTIRNLGVGSYNIRIRDAVGCLFDGSATVGANDPGVGAGFTTVNASCSGVSNGKIAINPSQGVAPFSYSLDGGATYNALDTIRNLAGGNYSIRVRDGLGCTWDAPAVQVGEDIGVTASFSSVNTACATAATGAILVNTLTGAPGFSYSIDGGANFQPDPVFRKLAAGSYNIRILDAAGCVFNSAAQQVNANPGVQASASTIRNASCESVPNGSITVNITAGIVPFEYTLTSQPGALPQAAASFRNLFPGSFSILVTDSAGCSLTLNETVGSDPKVRFSGLTIVRPTCNGATNGTVTAAVTLGVAPYSYSLDGSPFTAAAGFSNVAAGSHLLTVRDANNCSIDTSFTVTEPALLTAAVTSTTRSTCTGTADGSITVTATGGTSPYQYTLDAAGTSGYQASATLAARAGNYMVTTQDALGCTTTVAATVDSVFNMFLDLGRDTTICAEQSFTLRPATNNETSVFVYSPAGSLDNAGIRNPVASPLSPTTYRLTATFGICSLSDSVRVDVKRKPVANAGGDVIICFNGSTLLTGSASNTSGPVTFSWSPSVSVERADTSVTTANPAASQVYTLTVRDNYGCNFSVTDDVLVTKLPEPAPFAGNDTNAVYGIPHQLTGIGAGAGGTYAWELITPVNGSAVFSNRTSATPTIVFQPMGSPQGITYDSNYYRVALTTTDAAGCSGNDTVTIHIYNGPTYYVPSAFSPNNDGVNDVFRPVPVGVANTEYFRIFNRYGQLVYETNRFRQGWDGTFKGQPQPLGAYVWLLKGVDRNGRKIELKGTVMLVR